MSAREKKTCFSLLLSLFFLVTNPAFPFRKALWETQKWDLYSLSIRAKAWAFRVEETEGLCDRPGERLLLAL